MPEGPELYKAAQLVNTACNGHIFAGKIVKSAVNTKNPEVMHNFKEFTIRAESRGKEMALILSTYPPDQKNNECKKDLRILFRFGMSGRFQFTPISDLHKHAHLNFFTQLKTPKGKTNDKTGLVLSFVDVRRFGGWKVTDTWSEERGPDPMFEYEEFRSNIINNLNQPAFNKPLCEALHNQKYFNGIGNYLRAEIIFRSGVPPFTCARTALENINLRPEKKANKPDLLELCHSVPTEVINLPGVGYDVSGSYSGYSEFEAWLRCYYNPEVNNLVDHDGRTIWFKGPPGPMAPKDRKSRNAKNHRKRKAGTKTEVKVEIKAEKQESPAKRSRKKVQSGGRKESKRSNESAQASQSDRAGRKPAPSHSTLSSRKEALKRVQPSKRTKANLSKKHQTSSRRDKGKQNTKVAHPSTRSSARLRQARH